MSHTGSGDLPGVGARLRTAREDAGLSQGQAAKLLGVSRPAISELEAETRKLSAGELKRLAKIYRTSVDWLLGTPTNEPDQVRIAARHLERLTPADREIILRLARSLNRSTRSE